MAGNRAMISALMPCLAKPGKNGPDAVIMRFDATVRHGVDGEGDVEAGFIGLTRGGLDAGACRHTRYHHLGHAARLQLRFQIGAGKGPPCPFRNDNVVRLLIEFRHEVCPSFRARAGRASLFRPARSSVRDINENDRQGAGAKRIGQGPDMPDYRFDRMRERQTDDAFL